MTSNSIFSLHIPTRILFGCGEIKKLATEKMPGKKAMIVISGGTSMKKYGYLDKVINYLKENNVESIVFDKILPNPIKHTVIWAYEYPENTVFHNSAFSILAWDLMGVKWFFDGFGKYSLPSSHFIVSCGKS